MPFETINKFFKHTPMGVGCYAKTQIWPFTYHSSNPKSPFPSAVIVTQLVEQSLLTSEIRGSNPVINIFYSSVLLKLHRRDNNK